MKRADPFLLIVVMLLGAYLMVLRSEVEYYRHKEVQRITAPLEKVLVPIREGSRLRWVLQLQPAANNRTPSVVEPAEIVEALMLINKAEFEEGDLERERA